MTLGKLFLNVLHRTSDAPDTDQHFARIQQDIAHEAGLRTTFLINPENLFFDTVIDLAKHYADDYGDEIGISLQGLQGPVMARLFNDGERRKRRIWLCTTEEKHAIFELVFERFHEAFGRYPSALTSYYLDAPTINWCKEQYPNLEVVVASCFEEGTKVYRGCNYAWHLYSEGGPWWPWIPSKQNSQCPAFGPEDDSGVVAMPHLNRDLLLAVEDRDDYFSSHPMNVMRGLAFEDDEYPYIYNFIDETVLQSRYNQGYAHVNVYVSVHWMSPFGHQRWFDGDNNRLHRIYRDTLNYYAELKTRDLVEDVTMTEFARWFRDVRSYKPTVSLWDDVLCGTDRQIFWYADPWMRVAVNSTIGGSIIDLRPWAGRHARPIGADSPYGSDGSYPHMLQAMYRGKFSKTGTIEPSGLHVYLTHNGETVRGTSRRTQGKITQDGERTTFTLEPVTFRFADALTADLVTCYHFLPGGMVTIEREIVSISDVEADLTLSEEFLGIYGTVEYSADLQDITLHVTQAENTTTLDHYQYQGRDATLENVDEVGVTIPDINIVLRWKPDGPASGTIQEAELFTMMYILKLARPVIHGKVYRSWLKLENTNP